ncbi:survival protein sure-like phosphatase/nucleotidase [Fomitopsis serialis]|uniref:survival protein sure-like phosphatase/nucleotidase n=1 Tax=Fomitopsis serialis TaxID=139415 RepID=UPI0020078B05|nr:survival protein sure-like phosphatase/nucleotidase [Neoantrodia serialis]KAH9937665.1 survival protein sure-like phosphatase/nucleotidase [Neoantrodia serialis]
MTTKVPRVLLTASAPLCKSEALGFDQNDDGPPGPESPYIYGLYQHLTNNLEWDVKVVIPSTQKSWIGKAYHIHEVINGRFYYPQGPDGLGEISEQSRPLREGETAEWILLDGTPATCSNIALHNLYHGEIDLVISGPNFGRNSSAAFALSSGTIGAAMSASLSRTRAIALSYGTVLHPTPHELHEPAHVLATKIIAHLWAHWGADAGGGLRGGEIDLYNVNIPMVRDLLHEDGLRICWTTIWRNAYGRLFKAHGEERAAKAAAEAMSGAGPDSPGEGRKARALGGVDEAARPEDAGRLSFRWAPDMTGLITPQLSTLPVGSDGWAIRQGWASVTPIRASFAEPASEPVTDIEERIWKMKL